MTEYKRQLRTTEDVEDFVNGLAFLATGGGGPMEDGIGLLTDELAAGRELGWIDINDLPDDAWTVSTARIGGPGPKTGGPTPEELALYGLVEPDVHGNEGGRGQPRVNRQVVAVRELAKAMNIEIAAIVPLELGGGNTPGPLVTGIRLGLPTIDGDYTGRAIPELGNMKVEILGRQCAPIAYVDRWDNVTIGMRVVGSAMADRIGRHLGMASFGRLGMAGYLMRAAEAREAMVVNSLTTSLEVGQARRRGYAVGRPLEALLEHTDGWLLFRGRVSKVDWEAKGAFQHYYGTHHFEGIGPFEGHSFRIWFKNEDHVTWLDDAPFVTSPDLITVVDAQTGIPVINYDVREGQELAVIGMRPLDDIYRTEAALAVFSARHFGWDIEYVPIENQLGEGGVRTITGSAIQVAKVG